MTNLDGYIARVVAEAPSLSQEQVDILRPIFAIAAKDVEQPPVVKKLSAKEQLIERLAEGIEDE